MLANKHCALSFKHGRAASRGASAPEPPRTTRNALESMRNFFPLNIRARQVGQQRPRTLSWASVIYSLLSAVIKVDIHHPRKKERNDCAALIAAF